MSNVAHLPIEADRYGACVRTVHLVGLDATGVPQRAQVRLEGDTPGAPLVDLQLVTNGNAQGIRLVEVTHDDSGVPTSIVEIVINETTMEGLPYAGELGDATSLKWDWQLTLGGRKQRIARGAFVITGDGVTGADNAPANRPERWSRSISPTGGMRTGATLTFGDEIAIITIDGADLVAPLTRRAVDAADRAEADRDAAQLAAATALAASRYFPTRAAGEAASTANQLFSTDDGAGNLIYYRRTGGGSSEIGRALTPSSLAGAAGSSGVGFIAPDQGSVARTARDKLAEEVSVLDMGAVGDGLTDCSAAFEAAQNALGGRGVVLVPGKRTYLLESPVEVKPGVVWKMDGAIIKAGSDGMTMFYTHVASYSARFVGGTFTAKGKNGVTAFSVHHFNAAGGIFDCFFEDMARAVDLDVACFGGTIMNMFCTRVPRPIRIKLDGSAFHIINVNLDNGGTVWPEGEGEGIKNTGVGIEILGANPATIGCSISGYVQGFEYGIIDSGTHTRISCYFETNREADIFGRGAQHSVYRDCNFLADVGRVAILLRKTDGVIIDNPLMSSGARSVGLYDIQDDVDGGNTNHVELRADDGVSRNAPLGIANGLQRFAAQSSGTFTPTIRGGGSAGAGSYSLRRGRWTRTGRHVDVAFEVAWTGHTGSGALIITGAPSAIRPGDAGVASIGVVMMQNMPIPGVQRSIGFQGVDANMNIAVTDIAGVVTLAEVGPAGAITGRISYEL